MIANVKVVFAFSAVVLMVMSVSAGEVDYSRQIAPILAEHCFECHGPDANKREADLRLDVRDGAIRELDSGNTAIAPGLPFGSEAIRRLVSSDDDVRMPPEPAKRLPPEQIELLKQWIEQDANYGLHWSFAPLKFTPPVATNGKSTNGKPTNGKSTNGVDVFVDTQLAKAGVQAALPADRRTLIRRLYFDLVGLPPSPADVDRYLNDDRGDAYERLVDELLASPHYGERWGRHWLDVARYGDSNGGDENHAYPFAFEYRDYVIKALNDDVPFDRFVAEQIAGDLLADTKLPERRLERLKGTGFLAIGMKILAEQDPVKKQADLVDERLDTIGKSFLGLSIGCARCHDHKFDPIPTRDYYALAGILHSTEDEQRTIETKEYLAAKTKFEDKKQVAEKKVADLEANLNRQFAADEAAAETTTRLRREAESFDRGNVVVDRENYGKSIGVISDPGGQENFAEYDFEVSEAGSYAISLRYAAESERPGRLLIDGEVAKEEAIAAATGGWNPESQQWFVETVIALDTGKHVLRIESEPMMSHIDKWRMDLVPPDSTMSSEIALLTKAQTELAELRETEPIARQMMAVADGQVKDIQVHRRGSHLDLGETVPRGFLSQIAGSNSTAEQLKLPDSVSGRRELAQWITDSESGVGQLAARVIVNRLWHWHFGKGLVETPNNFGTMGSRPTHPELLDWLASELIKNGWSLKHLHKQIVTSVTYQRASGGASDAADFAFATDPGNKLLWRRSARRLEAEAIRDAALAVSGRLDRMMGGKPPEVKSQDPSPEDMQKNQQAYQGSRRRSVYLPVIRTNVYDLFTLFDFPNSASPVGRRSATTMPTQALLMMNDPFLINQSQQVGKNMLAANARSPEERIQLLYETLFARRANGAEFSAALEFLTAYEVGIENEDHAARRQAAWTAYCHTLLMSREFSHVQ